MAKLMNLPFTELGAKLVVDEETERNCKAVYKLDGKGGAVFHSLYDENQEYPDDYIVVSFRSVVDGESDEFEKGENFANIEGSAHDPHTGSWKDIMERAHLEHCDLTSCCAQQDTIYVGNSDDVRAVKDVLGDKKFTCLGHIVGGHVVMNEKNSKNGPYDGEVLLLPICNNHNIFNYLRAGTGGKGYYMKLGRKTSGLKLKHYLRLPKPSDETAE